MEVHSRVPVVIKFCIFHVETSEIIFKKFKSKIFVKFWMFNFIDFSWLIILITTANAIFFSLCVEMK